MKAFFGQKGGRKRSEAILRRLEGLEAEEIMDFTSDFPVVIRKATGARVRDADGNRYVDLTSFFGVALVGHRNPSVVRAVRVQLGRLLHAAGDCHPADKKAEFLSELAKWLPADYKAVLSLSGSEAVETALKFAAAATSSPYFIAFEGAYHGLTGGALEATAIETFRKPFAMTLRNRAHFVPFPKTEGEGDMVLERVRRLVKRERRRPTSIIIEPIQGRGGIRVPPAGFLKALSDLAREASLLLICDEVYTGVGRTGRFLRSEAEGIVPDCLCLGKALGGGLPLSVCLMRPHVASMVKGEPNEAVHTSTFLGHPLGCAAGIAVLKEIQRRDLLSAALRIGETIKEEALRWAKRYPIVKDVRGAGAMVGVELAYRDRRPASKEAAMVIRLCLERGVMLFTEGESGNVLAFTPPLVISEADLRFALRVVESCIRDVCGG